VWTQKIISPAERPSEHNQTLTHALQRGLKECGFLGQFILPAPDVRDIGYDTDRSTIRSLAPLELDITPV
jgi:hypothetical protein